MAHIFGIDVRFADIDKMGHVNNAKLLTYFEQARMYYFKEVLGDSVDWNKQGLILARTEVNFIEPIRLDDEITVATICTRIGTKSFEMAYQVFRTDEKNKTEVASGSSVLVSYDYSTSTSIQVPQMWIDRIEKFEKGSK